LGLAVVRTIVERHGGTIGADPGPDGVGTVFTVRLPPPNGRHAEEDRPA
jgi:two-component system OmpR family sensor kinase